MMAKKKLSLSERIALAASGTQEDEYPEDIEYETSAKVVDVNEDEFDEPKRGPQRSSLRAKNVKLLDELDTRYGGEKVSRKKLELTSKNINPISRKANFSAEVDDDSGEEMEEDTGEEDTDNDNSDSDPQFDDGSDVNSELNDELDAEEEYDLHSDESNPGKEEESETSDDEEDDDGSESESDNENGGEGTIGMQTLSIRDKELELQKGKATLNQIRIWDSMLEVRIRLQKILIDCNRLPTSKNFEEITENMTLANGDKFPKLLKKSQGAASVLIYELLRLQKILINQNSETKQALESNTEGNNENVNGLNANQPMNDEITSEEEEEEKDTANLHTSTRKRKLLKQNLDMEQAKKAKPEQFLADAEDMFTGFRRYRNQIIQKWNDKTQFVGGKFNRKTTSHQISTVKQIDQILSNKERLVKRTQIPRTKYAVIGEEAKESESNDASTEKEEQLNPEIFDDDDFYHQLLRELIERKTSNVNDPIQLSHHWLELQKLRTKLKKKVDTKASKGRKIRYDVHSKLVNYMAPYENCSMSTAAVKELYSSLFGKIKT